MYINTIIAIISAVIMIYLTASLDSKKRITVTDIIALLLSLTLFVVMCKGDKIFARNISEAYDRGFNTAIQSAELLYSDDNTYYINFGGNVHEYQH